jgi:hypothetical protein
MQCQEYRKPTELRVCSLCPYLTPKPVDRVSAIVSDLSVRNMQYLDRVIPLWEVHLLLLLPLGDLARLALGQLSPQGARLLRSQVERLVLLVLVEKAQLCSLGRVDDCEDAGDRLSDVGAVGGPVLELRDFKNSNQAAERLRTSC